MTNEEEKILEEENDITLEEAAEEAEDLQEEAQDEGRAIEIPIERREDASLEEILERQVLRGGLRGVGHPEMIQKHLDNFLAAIAGETPVDTNVRTSTEFWLKMIADIFAGSVASGNIWKVNLLWTNDSPTATMGEVTIPLDLSGYDLVMVIARYSNTGTSALQPPVFCALGDTASVNGVATTSVSYRTFTPTATGITFSIGRRCTYGETSATTASGAMIPYQIFGIKKI